MPLSIIIGRTASSDINDVADHYDLQEPREQLGRAFIDECFAAMAFLAENPLAGSRYPTRSKQLGDVRRWRLRRFGSYIRYHRIDDGSLRVARVIHGARARTDKLLREARI